MDQSAGGCGETEVILTGAGRHRSHGPNTVREERHLIRRQRMAMRGLTISEQ